MPRTNSPNPISAQAEQQSALTCYQSVILAIAKCMAEVCPGVGLVYRDRLARLPRRLGFDPTPEALAASREAVEADLAEYAQGARAWINTGVELAQDILAADGNPPENDGHGDELRAAGVDEIAEQMEICAEVDDAAQMRAALRRYATGLRAYAQRRKKERPPALTELQRLAEGLADWLGSADPANIVDSSTGLLNRNQPDHQLQACLNRHKPFCLLLIEWTEARSVAPHFGRSGTDQILKALGDHLIALVRPRDVVYRWGQDQLAVILECTREVVGTPSRKISGSHSSKYSAGVDRGALEMDANNAA